MAAECTKNRKTLAGCASGEIEEKKSVFIADAAPVSSEDEARAFIDAVKKKYHDASHHVYAYVLAGGSVARYSDDGEPQGTGGIPVLNVIKSSGASDCVIVVTRYFGGTLLGTGGLSRAYGSAAKAAADAAGIAEFEEHARLRVLVSYPDYQKIASQISKLGAAEESSSFGADVECVWSVKLGREAELSAKIAEITAGRAKVTADGVMEKAVVRS